MISAATQAQALDALRRSRSVVLTAYILGRGAVLNGVFDALRRGTRVSVRLEGRPYKDAAGRLQAMNLRTVRALKAAGADAALVDGAGSAQLPLHMKALICDSAVYLDDRNWPDHPPDFIVRDDKPADVQAVRRAALEGLATAGRSFWTDKRDAEAAQTRLLSGARHARTVDVETESFGSSPQVFQALRTLALAHVRCRLIVAQRVVSPRSRHELALLERAGVRVRAGASNEKMAIVDGARAWTGSANASFAGTKGDQIDWGLRTAAPALVRPLRERFAANWAKAKALA
ncbi:MAG: phospholipase D family protein [Candidatus Baltobacteraceae bacterium]